MKAGEARRLAQDWVLEQRLPSLKPRQQAAVVGAYVMGSVAARADEEPFDETASDIDVAIVVDDTILPLDHAQYPHGNFLIWGRCALQAIFLPVARIEDERSLLTMLGLGCNLRSGHILTDPHGKLSAAREVVVERWTERRWLV